METKNAIIKESRLKIDNGYLCVWIMLDFGNGGCKGFGVQLPEDFSNHDIKSFSGKSIFRFMQIAGVTDWSRICGQSIRARVDKGLVFEIGHIINDDWFSPIKEVL